MIPNLLFIFLLYVWKASLLLIIYIYALTYIFTNRTHFNTQLMLLGFEMYHLKNICFSNVIIIGNFFTPVNVLFDNYLHYCIHVPVYFNCMNVLSSAFDQFDFYVLLESITHIYFIQGFTFHSHVRRGEVLGGRES